MNFMPKSNVDFNENPFIVIWEVTRACALKCLHCRAEAQYKRDPRELTFEEGKRLLDDIAGMGKPLVVFTGGDPLERPDLYDLARYAIQEKGLSVAMSPSATPKVTRKAIEQAKQVGLSRWAFSLDGSSAEIHDHFRGVKGSYDLTMQAIEYLNELEIPIQINTTVSRYNLQDLPAIADRIEQIGAVLWSAFFLIPTGRAQAKDMISPEEHEEVVEWLAKLNKERPFHVKTTEAPFYRRVFLQSNGGQWTFEGADGKLRDFIGRAPKGVNDGDGFVFVSHIGDVNPSGFLPEWCGNIRETPLSEIYRNSPIMRKLRDKDALVGKCGVCEFKQVCGGSRARAYNVTGNYMGSDPACAYIPEVLRRA